MLETMKEYPFNQILSTYAVTPISLLQNPYHVRNAKMPTHGNVQKKYPTTNAKFKQEGP